MNFGGNQGQGQSTWNFGNSFKAPTTTATTSAAPATGFSFSMPSTAAAQPTTAAPSFGMFGQPAATSAAPATTAPATATASLLFNTLSQPTSVAAATVAVTTPKTVATTTTATVSAVAASAASAPATAAAPVTTASWKNAPQPSTVTSTAATSTTATMTFAQLEENIGKSIEEFQEQETMFLNQSMQINSWDLVLMENSDKIIALRTYFEHLRGLQEELEQDMDFVVSQQKELEDLIEPLQKELDNMPVTDDERKATYEIAENIDSSLKQMTNELKDIVESVNESNKEQENNPLEKIGRILNVHMNSLQWIDRNVTQIENNLNQLSKIENAIVEDVTKLVN